MHHEDREEYNEYVSLLKIAVEKHGVDKVADALNISRPTVERHMKEANLPHIALLAPMRILLRSMTEAG